MGTKKDHQYDGVQALRFLAALLVVTTHSFFYTKERLTDGMEWGFGSRGVDIFFVISGFVMIISSRDLIGTNQDWAKFAIQRITRVVPLYWIATTAKVVIMIVSSGLVMHANFDIENILKSYIFIPHLKDSGKIEPILGVGWTLVFEMFFYGIFTLALFLKLNVYKFVGAIMISMAALSSIKPNNQIVWMFLFDPMVLEFYFGMLIGRLALKKRHIRTPPSIMIIASIILYITSAPSFGLPRFIEVGIPAALLVYATVSIEKILRNKIHKIFLFYGAASYSLYLFHPLLVPAVPIILKKAQLPITSLSVIFCITLSLAAAAFIYRFIELPITHLTRLLPFTTKYSHKPITER